MTRRYLAGSGVHSSGIAGGYVHSIPIAEVARTRTVCAGTSGLVERPAPAVT